MRILLSALLIAMMVAAGCGAATAPKDPSVRKATEAANERDKACAAGKGNVEISEVLPRVPRGLEITAADPKFMEPAVEPLRRTLGDRLLDIETRVVVPKGRTSGTGFVLTNARESSGPPGEVVRAARRAAKRNPGLKYDEITVAGARAVIVTQTNGDVQVHAPLGDCAAAFLFDVDRERILRVANALRAPASG